ncbi:MAG: hypothetical protein ACOZHQ_07305 [Thermodesulfobacteriota bacterium]
MALGRPRRPRTPSRLAAAVLALALTVLSAAAVAAAEPEAWSLSDWDAAWQIPPAAGVERAGRVTMAYLEAPALRAAVFPGSDQEPGLLVSRPLPLKPGAVYELSFELMRPQFVNGHYLSVDLWGHETLLDQHCTAGGWQAFRVRAAYAAGDRPVIVFRNDTPSRFMLRNPSLRAVAGHPAPPGRFAPPASRGPGALPIGVYGAARPDWPRLRECGFDLATASLAPAEAAGLLAEAAGLGLRLIPFLPNDAAKLLAWGQGLAGLAPELRPPFFYLADEPELRSLDPARLGRLRDELRAKLPWAALATAMVRPQLVENYAGVYDAVFMDQYPVPNQPLNWLADSVAQARAALPGDRQVWAVVQAFALPKDGWPRLPDYGEMQALAFSALAEGAQGVMFFTWRQMKDDPAHRANVCRLVARLRGLEPWLPLLPGPGPGLALTLAGRVRQTPSGGAAVRAGHGVRQGRRLVLAVNQTPYPVSVRLAGLEMGPLRVQELLSGGVKAALAGELRETIEPLGARAWLLPAPAASGRAG